MDPQDDKPRPQHYEFAHRAMPSITLNPDVDLARLVEGDRLQAALLQTWTKIGESHPEVDRLSANGLAGRLVDVADSRALLLSFPQPSHMAEVFLAVVAPLDPPSARRYFTLELSWDFAAGQAGTIIGEWGPAGHTNFGTGPAGNDAQGFLDRVGIVLG